MLLPLLQLLTLLQAPPLQAVVVVSAEAKAKKTAEEEATHRPWQESLPQ